MTVGATKYIGERIRRREDPRFLTGRTRYVDDIRLPGTVHAAFVRSPHAHAVITALHTERASAVPGVGIDLQVGYCPLSINVAMPAGLLVNEMLTNALKYAFPAGKAKAARGDACLARSQMRSRSACPR